MGLAQQLITLLSLLLMFAFGGSFVLGVNQAKAYLNQQLGVHAQDTATALAVAYASPAIRVWPIKGCGGIPTPLFGGSQLRGC